MFFTAWPMFRAKRLNTICLQSGETRPYTWITNVYSPTKDLAGAVIYAETYVLTPNSEYTYFSTNGDCTNFVSQILYEGGGFPQVLGQNTASTSWFYMLTYPGGYSHSWTVVSDFYAYMRDTAHIVDDYSLASFGIILGDYPTYIYPTLAQGNVIRYQFQDGGLHNAFVIGWGADSVNQSLFEGLEPLVDYHSTDRKHINWTLISVNPQWTKTILVDNRIKWDY